MGRHFSHLASAGDTYLGRTSALGFPSCPNNTLSPNHQQQVSTMFSRFIQPVVALRSSTGALRQISTSNISNTKVAVLGASGGIGQPLSIEAEPSRHSAPLI